MRAAVGQAVDELRKIAGESGFEGYQLIDWLWPIGDVAANSWAKVARDGLVACGT